METSWQKQSDLPSFSYICGHCGNQVASNKGMQSIDVFRNGYRGVLYICPHCAKPTSIIEGKQIPDVAPGNPVDNVPDDVSHLYDEARVCVSASAYTASVLACRKLLMNISVQQGANEGLRFIEYINYLAENGYVPPNGRGWVDHIRKKGNEATHEIPQMTRDDAEELVLFSEMLLKFIYEFPARVPSA
ncbi:MAG: DUF4145 domain-containing protein [Pseudomonadota bacterium]